MFGMAVALLFAGAQSTRVSNLANAIFYVLALSLQVIFWRRFGLQTTKQLYPFITHIPLIIYLALYYKRPWLIAISSGLTSYLCSQIPRWFGSVAAALSGYSLADHIGYFITMCVVYYLLRRYVAGSVSQLMERSTRSCLLFGTIPFMHYLFDYATTFYTDLLYSGAPLVVQFTPSMICTSYLVFVLIYYNESQEQVKASRERDILASQLKQAQVELDTMRQLQHSTSIHRHDMRHHLSLLDSFAVEGNLQKINEYLTNTEADIEALTPVHYCDNETANLILSSFEARARKENVILHTDVKLPEELGINDTELCALLSNALENAITAAAQIEDEKLRKVYIRAVINNGRLILSTENAFVGTIEMEGELPRSKNKEIGHGFGIKSMTSIVERHGGLYSFETEGGVFILQLLLPLDLTKHKGGEEHAYSSL
jgi:two-component system, LytTR family, sensor histidine kinase AgrC